MGSASDLGSDGEPAPVGAGGSVGSARTAPQKPTRAWRRFVHRFFPPDASLRATSSQMCPHMRPSWQQCPHCLGVNRQQAPELRTHDEVLAEFGLTREDPIDLQAMISRAFEIADSEYPSKGNAEPNEWEDARWYSMLRALVIDAFNPPDDDVAECSLLADAVARAFEFVASAPCECKGTPMRVDYGTGVEWDWDVCSRCQVLGRVADERQDR